MNDNNFRRVEQKYLINEKQFKEFISSIKEYIEKDIYHKSNISSIYFDNDNNDLLINSLEKPIYKDKVRIRSYDIPTIDSKIYLEIKSKYKGTVGKRRIKLTLKEFNEYMETGKYKKKQIMDELDYYFKYYDLKPFIFVYYDRISYKSKDNSNLRITFDSNLSYRLDDLRLDSKGKNIKYFKDKTYIMEIKTLDSMPLWLTNVLAKLKIYPTSFSKVGSIYSKIKGEC